MKIKTDGTGDKEPAFDGIRSLLDKAANDEITPIPAVCAPFEGNAIRVFALDFPPHLDVAPSIETTRPIGAGKLDTRRLGIAT